MAHEATQPIATSSTTISVAQATEIRAQVRQAIQEGFGKARPQMGEIPKEHKMRQDTMSFNARFGVVNSAPSLIDLVTALTPSPQVVESGVLPASPISVANTPSHVANGGSAPGFSHVTQNTIAASAQTMFATMHWKPKEPPCYYGHSTEDIHT